jgi:predicted RNA-binding Zn-ribbon protein involved in translation (DUF1610 family)
MTICKWVAYGDHEYLTACGKYWPVQKEDARDLCPYCGRPLELTTL